LVAFHVTFNSSNLKYKLFSIIHKTLFYFKLAFKLVLLITSIAHSLMGLLRRLKCKRLLSEIFEIVKSKAISFVG
jgi:hypothetical protein